MRQILRRRDDEDVDTLHRKMLAYEIDLRRLTAEKFAQMTKRTLKDTEFLRLKRFATDLIAYTATLEASRWWQARKAVRRLLRRADSVQRPVPVETELLRPENGYDLWLETNAPRAVDLEQMRAIVPFLISTPTFSIVMPVYQTVERYLRAAIESVIAQTYPHWQLCVVDDCSKSPHVTQVLHEYAAIDSRIQVRTRSDNGHIARASNDALEMATGDFVALLDHDDVLQPDALFENALALNERPGLDMIYSDEDKIDDLGIRSGPFFKPDWSPDTFLTKMYTGHLGVYRRKILNQVGGFRPGFEGAQDYDLVLRLSEQTNNIHHIQKVLYSWRLHPGSTSQNADSKDYAYENSQRAIQAALDRRGEGGTVSAACAGPGHWAVRYTIKNFEKVSVVVPTRNGTSDVRRCLDSVFGRTDYPNYEVLLLDNGSDRNDALNLFARYKRSEPLRFRYLRHDVPFNYSEINNFAVEHTNGAYLLFLNNDTEVVRGDWMSAMVEYAQRPSIGAVGAKLIYGNGSIQHAGVVIGIQGIAGHSHRHSLRTAGGYANNLVLTTNYSAVTAACMMTRREAFLAVGGFDETFAIAYNDVDLCLRFRERGLFNVYLPHVELIHYESQSRGYDTSVEQLDRDLRERVRLNARWQQAWSQDPFYNPHLSLDSEDFRLATG